MSKGIYKPNQGLHTVLVSQETHSYLVTDIRDLLLEADGKSRNSSEMRRWVNGQFQTLVKHGYIKKVLQSGSRTKFVNTDKILGKQNLDIGVYKLPKNETLYDQILILKNRLREYKTDIFISSGETKECEEIGHLMPVMRTKLQKTYNAAKEQNIELIGRIKVLELLIAELS